MVAKAVDLGVNRWKEFAASARKIASRSAHGHVNLPSAIKLAVQNARHLAARCVVRASIQNLAEWSAASRIVELCAQKSPTFVQPRIVPNAKQNAPSQYAK
jgi:hypothetical protein